jgi:hypothetical protein
MGVENMSTFSKSSGVMERFALLSVAWPEEAGEYSFAAVSMSMVESDNLRCCDVLLGIIFA